ncbi:cell division protein FtsK [Candidatus Desantisbacteria bacterium CG_4_9_14_3_um_filter_40_11]|uniref:Cell division protein FtsK n=5 Tax=unclassified Candidatus Desantisiibacteriota TaxID=3106372 RepID=A0A2M7JA43_9BACT|nr:MAG: cell division protein FtsK [Candidatus Desantisbacteria bacterium CG23_combo_of_CG06-09_8_20_14_all_40_23]PIX16278.1 MAG: cell division protein FtsK [Candidatus Desantisbacteria bacterium CG_4_8_14_3_um_filter_40_12]PIY18869.1 MAG: cell division protein FtsK [Candidatus Desantisbacteria bacterium CG_4_10_14_3_um_filter_40_18]PJB29358.1 MAG: cell division protein FtsK [Candidatus Desantisbacteria bacterium CG_4_9_14_3_um_filter_40_11]
MEFKKRHKKHKQHEEHENHESKQSNQNNHPPIVDEIIGIMLLGFSILLIFALIAPDKTGRVGEWLYEKFINPFGTGAYFIPIVISIFGWDRIKTKELRGMEGILRGMGGILLLLAISTLLSLFYLIGNIMTNGGFVGTYLGLWLANNFHYGAFIIVFTCIALGFILLTRSSAMIPFNVLKRVCVWGWGMVSAGLSKAEDEEQERIEEKSTAKHSTRERDREKIRTEKQEKEEKEEKTRDIHIPRIVMPKEIVIAPHKIIQPIEGAEKIYQLPDMSLLKDPPPASEEDLREDLLLTSKLLGETLEDFGIDAKVVQVNRGPVLTSFEVQPAAGVKVSKIVSLSDDLALVLAAPSIRIEAPIPGKQAVGIEIPNRTATMVGLKEVLLAEQFQFSSAILPLALGKDIMGNPVVTDLTKMPHMLVAGATGSGKSVCINGIIMSILYKMHPDNVKLLMIDPKMVELSVYDGIPHLRFPVITGPKEAVKCLKWLVKEMEDRYKLLAAEGARHITGYNDKLLAREENTMCYVVAIIDELADLMMVSSQECEDSIARLTQMARAVGIHLILATQRPSVDIITGVIKANFPCRVAFQVFSKIDSRTILDMNGADKLLGRGDMLFLPPGAPKPIRIQGAFLSNEEIEDVIKFIRLQGFEPHQEKFTADTLEEKQTIFDEDDLLEDVLRLAVRNEGVSTSMIQRKLKIGYNRASRLVEMLEEHNFVGPSVGIKPREVYINQEDLDRLFERR